MGEKQLTNLEIFEILKKRIIRLDYAPGEILNESDIAEEFKISRTPVRKIFDRLKSIKLLNIIPRYGAQVAPIDFKYMKMVFEVIRELDAYATKLAANRMSEESILELEEIIERIKGYNIYKDYQKLILDDGNFHHIIFRGCENPCLLEIIGNLHIHTERLWFYVQKDITEINLFIDTLSNILKALKARDADLAEKYAKEHTDMFVEKIKEKLL
jgi:DNA-binding GntR family transcriptional regulator